MSNPQPPRNNGTDIPLKFRLYVLGLLTVTLVVHIFVDIAVTDYEGKGTSYLLGTIVGCSFGLNTVIAEFLKGRGGQ